MAHSLRILFMGTGDIAIPGFEALIESHHDLLGLVTQPDKPVGRKQVIMPPAIKTVALEHNLPIWQPEKAKSKAFLETLEELAPDIIVVMAYGQILTQRLIDIPKVAIINVHASLLPLYRGASCIQGPIADGHSETGVTIMHVVKALDAGDIILQKKTPISPGDTGGSVHDRLAEQTPDALLAALAQLADGSANRTPQCEEDSTYAPKLLRHDGEMDCSVSATQLERLIRAYHPWPGTFTQFLDKKGKKKRLKIFPPVLVTDSDKPAGTLYTADEQLFLACGQDSALQLERVQPEGSRAMSAVEFLKGNPL